MDGTVHADVGTRPLKGNVAACSKSANRHLATRPETGPQLSFAGLLAWALPPLGLIGILIIQGA
jgi:hypothetical protein